MRGKFVLVLGIAVAAAVAVTGWEPRSQDGPAEGAAAPPDALTRAEDPVPRPSSGPHPLVSRLDDFLARGDLGAAARALLESETGVLASSEVRARAFRLAAELERQADEAPGPDATKARLRARRLYAALFDAEECTVAQRDRAFEASKRLNRALVFGNGAPEELVLRHKILPGDRLWNLSKGPWKDAGVTVAPGFVLHANGISDPRRIRAGQMLHVPLESLSILVRKQSYELTVLLGGSPIERFKVGIGADDSTPVGRFNIRTRLEKPDWYFRGRKIPYGDPENVIGTRWLGFGGGAEAEGIGIHGTNDDASVGKAVSMGCIRMRDPDVERLFDWVAVGTAVEVRN